MYHNKIGDMVVSGMSLQEKAEELIKDHEELIRRWRRFMPKLNRERLKWNVYPRLYQNSLTTNRKNKWEIIMFFYSKKDAEIAICRPCFFTTFIHDGELWFAMCVGGDKLFLFPRHFRERIVERENFIERIRNSKVLESISDCFMLFISLNHWYVAEPRMQGSDDLRAFCESGMLLGKWLTDKVLIVKTFLSVDEMKMNQFVEYNNKFNLFLSNDMFLAHKGYDYDDGEMFDIEVTNDYVIPNESWFKYLINRGNIYLITLARTNVKRHAENLEEYNKLDEMLTAIHDNGFENLNDGNCKQ